MSHTISASQDGRVSSAEPELKVAWFCIQSQPKHEHIAAKHLRGMEGVEVLNPRVRFMRSTRLGPVSVTEALFPSYLFARFDWKTSLARVHYAPGVKGVVHFGTRWPTVPDHVVEGIRKMLGDGEIHEIPTALAPGDKVEISGEPFHGLEAVVLQVMPGRQRVMVLMEFLGQQSAVEVGMGNVVKSDSRH